MNDSTFADLIECSVCLNQLNEQNGVLPCQHTFCLKCLGVVIKSKGHLQCPECRTDYYDISLGDLPKNFLLVRILEGLKNKRRSHTEDTAVAEVSASDNSNCRRNDTANRLSAKVKYEASLNQPCGRGLYNFNSSEEGDLPFSKGDIITVVHEIDDNWWEGVLKGKRGAIPKVFVEILVPLPKMDDKSVKIPYAKALYSYDSREEPELISFKEGDIIGVIKKVDGNWFEGVLGGQYGIFPVNFVQLNKCGDDIMNGNSCSCSSSSDEESHSKRKHSRKLKKSNKYLKQNSALEQTQFQIAEQPKRHTIHVENPNDQERQSRRALNLSEDAEQPHFRQRALSQGRKLSDSSQDGRHLTSSNITPVGGEIAFTANSTTTTTTITTDAPLNTSVPNRLLPLSTTPCHGIAHADCGEPYTALFTYSPAKDDELALIQGDQYVVVEKYLDGWYRGIHQRSQQSGVFPGNYVRLSSQISPQMLQQVISSPSRNVIGYGSNPSSPVPTSSTTFEFPSQRISGEIPDSQAAPAARQNVDNATRVGMTGLLKMLKKTKPKPATQSTSSQAPQSSQSPPSYYHSSMPQPMHRRVSRPSPMVPAEPPPPYTPTPVIGENTPVQTSGVIQNSPAGEKFRAIAIFPASHDSEMSLRVGDIVYVTKKYLDGWYTGKSSRTGATGLFPSIFVEACL